MSFSRARASRIASSCPKDFDFQFFIFQEEGEYAAFFGWRRLLHSLYDLPENIAWNFIILALYLVVVVRVAYHINIKDSEYEYMFNVVECVANILYAVYLVAIIYNDHKRIQYHEIKFSYIRIFWYFLEVMSFSHYYFQTGPQITKHLPYGLTRHDLQFYCYLLRLPRVFKFLGDLNSNYLKGTIIATLVKYFYIFYITRVILTYLVVRTGFIEEDKNASKSDEINSFLNLCFRGSYIVLKLFIQLRLRKSPTIDFERMIFISINMVSFVMFSGITISAFSQVVEVHIRPWETFNVRLKLIIRTFKHNNISKKLSETVVTFYRMYWLKQSAVSSSSLLKRMTPTLQNFILSEIYFESQQKSRILRDMSFQLLQEVAKVMKTVNYVPGDLISTRGTHKSFMIFIEYGDAEVLTAEDDDTPILRFTRGSVINPCGLAVEVGATQAHVCVRAATFCTAHILHTTDFWRVCAKFGRFNAQSYIARSSFEEHMEAVKKHYPSRKKIPVKFKSSIFVMKRNLLALKEARDGDGRLLLGRADKFIEVAGCYIMRNTASTSLMEEVDSFCLKPTFPCILQPNSSLLVFWQTFVAANTVYIALAYPYQKIYYKTISKSLEFYDWFATFIYAVDVVVVLSTGEKIEEGVPVTLAKTASEQLKKPLILVDIFVAAPITIFFQIDPRFNGLHKLLKLIRVFMLMKKFEDIFIFRRNLLRFLEYAFFMILLIYFVAALKQAVFCHLYQLCMIDNYTNFIFWKRGELDDSPNYESLLMSVLWSLLLITFSDILTDGPGRIGTSDAIIQTALLEMCIVFRILINGIYAAVIISMETSREEFASAMKTINNFLVKNNIRKNLKARLLEYFKLSWHFDEGYKITHQRKSLLSDLPKHVFAKVQAEQKSHLLKRLRFWKYLSSKQMELVSTKATPFFSAPNEIILNTGDTISEMYMIRHGFCEVYSPRTKAVVKILGPNANFGDIEMIFRIPVFYSVRAVTHVELLSLSKKHLLSLFKSRRFQAAMRYCAQQPEFRGAQRRRDAFLHYQPPAPPRSLQRFPVLRKFEPDVAFQSPFQRLGFLAVLRYVFPRFTIRPDGPYLRRYEWFRAGCAFLSSLIYPTYGWLCARVPILEHVGNFLDYSAYFDILQRMLVGFYNEKGVLIYHPASTAAHYIGTAFLLDLFASLPFESLDEMRLTIYYDDGMYRQPSLYSYLMFNRGVQLYRTVITLGTLKDYIPRQELVLILQALPVFLYILSMHVTHILEDTVHLFTNELEGYKYRIKTAEEAENLDSHNNWMKLFAPKTLHYNVTATPWNVVLTSYFFLIDRVTTTCYNYFYPHNVELVEISLIAIFIIMLLVTYIGMRIISLRSQVDKSLASFQEHMKDTETFMRRENFCMEIQKEVLSYFAYRWEQTGNTDSRDLLKLCDQISLRTDAILQIFGHTLIRCPVLRHCERTLLRQLGRGLHSEYFSSGMIIIEQEDVIDHMYFVEYGTVAVYRDIYREDPIMITKLPRGSVFGNIGNHAIALCNKRFMVTEKAHLLVMKTHIFYKIIQDYPKIQALLVKYRPNNENYIIGAIAGTTKVMSTWKERALSSAITAVSGKGVGQFFKIFQNKTNAALIYLIIVTYCSIISTIYNCVFYYDDHVIALTILYGLDILFLLKLVVNYLVVYIFGINEGERSLLSNVTKSRFISEYKHDLISVVPFEVFALLDKQHPWLTFGLLRINRLFRVSCMKKSLSQYRQRLSINLPATTMATGFLWFFLMIHILACTWYLIACYVDNKNPKTSWLYDKGAENKPISGNGYFMSLYTMLSLFLHIGHEDHRGKTLVEIFFMAILMVLSSTVFMIFVGEFSNIIQFVNFRVMEYYSEKLECEKFLEGKFIAPALVDRVNKYILYLWREQRGLQMPHFVATAPMCVRNKVMATAYMSHLVQHSIFGECEASFLRQLVGCFRVYTYMKGMHVVKEGEVTDAMYFVHKGSVKEIAEDYEEELLDFEVGHHFGTFNGINPNSPFNYTYKTKTRATILHLYFDDWKYLLDHFPVSQNIILTNQNQDKDYDIGIKQKVKKKDVEKPDSERPLLRFASAKENLSNLQSENIIEETETEAKSLTSRKSVRKSTLPAQSFKGIPKGRESGDEYTLRSAAESSAPSTDPSIKWPSFTRQSVATTGPTYKKRDSKGENTMREVEQLSLSSQLIDVPSPADLNTQSSESVEMDNLDEEVVEEESYVTENRRRKTSVHFEKLSAGANGTAAKPFEGKRSSIAEVEIDSIDYSKQVTKKEKDSSTPKMEDILQPKDTVPDVPADKPDISHRKSPIEKSGRQEDTKLLEGTEEGNAKLDYEKYIAILPSQSGVSLLDTQPAPVASPDIFIDFIDDTNSTKQRSIELKDEVETVEIPKDKSHDTTVKDLAARETDQLQSTMSSTGAIALKERIEEIEEILRMQEGNASIRTQSITSTRSTDSQWSVEGYMMHDAGESRQRDRGPSSLTSLMSVASRSKSMESTASDFNAFVTVTKKEKKGLVWKEEDTMHDATANKPHAWLQGTVHIDMLDDDDLEQEDKGKKKDRRY